MTITKSTINDVTIRAAAAFVRSARKNGGGIPMLSDLRVEESGGRSYVTWRESGALVGCYRIRTDGKLKHLVRPPRQLADAA
jgi:hypothetical protein